MIDAVPVQLTEEWVVDGTTEPLMTYTFSDLTLGPVLPVVCLYRVEPSRIGLANLQRSHVVRCAPPKSMGFPRA